MSENKQRKIAYFEIVLLIARALLEPVRERAKTSKSQAKLMFIGNYLAIINTLYNFSNAYIFLTAAASMFEA